MMSSAISDKASSLPVDIIALILDELDDEPYHKLDKHHLAKPVVIAAQVSRTWRSVAQAHRRYAYHLGPPDDVGHWPAWRTKLLAAPTPLELTLYAGSYEPPAMIWADVCHAIANRMALIRRLIIRTEHSAKIEAFFAATRDSPAPLLHSLTVWSLGPAIRHTKAGRFYSQWFGGSSPRLYHIDLWAVDALPPPTVLANVRRLTVAEYTIDIEDLMAKCPTLRHLQLICCMVDTSATTVVPHATSTPALRSLSLSEVKFHGNKILQLQRYFDALNVRTVATGGSTVVARGTLASLDQHHLSLDIIYICGPVFNIEVKEQGSGSTAPDVTRDTGDLRHVRRFEFCNDATELAIIWQQLKPAAFTTITLSQRNVVSTLQTLPSFCLPNLVRMRIVCPKIDLQRGDIDVAFWRGNGEHDDIGYDEDLAQRRVLAPRLQQLEVFVRNSVEEDESASRNGWTSTNPPYLLRSGELATFATRVLGLTPEEGTIKSLPTLRLINLRMVERQREPDDIDYTRLFGRIVRAVEIGREQIGEDEELRADRTKSGQEKEILEGTD